jgi:hypothetical protein
MKEMYWNLWLLAMVNKTLALSNNLEKVYYLEEDGNK